MSKETSHCAGTTGTIEEMDLQTSAKTVSDGADLRFCVRVYHSRETATGKARLPMVERRVPHDSSHVTAPYRLSFYYYYYFFLPSVDMFPREFKN